MKIVFTGGPSTGKSSVIALLKKQGHNTLDEVARKYMQERGLEGQRLPEPEFIKMQEDIFQEYERLESKIDNQKEIYFLDRSSIDGYGYCKHILGHVPESIQNINTKRHEMVFLFDLLPFKVDGLRWEKNKEEAETIHKLIEQSYTNLGYKPIRVPVFQGKNLEHSIRQRANFVKRYLFLGYEGAAGEFHRTTYKGRTIFYKDFNYGESIEKKPFNFQEEYRKQVDSMGYPGM